MGRVNEETVARIAYHFELTCSPPFSHGQYLNPFTTYHTLSQDTIEVTKEENVVSFGICWISCVQCCDRFFNPTGEGRGEGYEHVLSNS